MSRFGAHSAPALYECRGFGARDVAIPPWGTITTGPKGRPSDEDRAQTVDRAASDAGGAAERCRPRQGEAQYHHAGVGRRRLLGAADAQCRHPPVAAFAPARERGARVRRQRPARGTARAGRPGRCVVGGRARQVRGARPDGDAGESASRRRSSRSARSTSSASSGTSWPRRRTTSTSPRSSPSSTTRTSSTRSGRVRQRCFRPSPRGGRVLVAGRADRPLRRRERTAGGVPDGV